MRCFLTLTLILMTVWSSMLLAQTKSASIPEKPEVILVEQGVFMMGSESGERDEKPVHEVRVDSFSIGKYEITVSQYKAFCTATGRKMPPAPEWGWNDLQPILNVSYNDAIAYCDWLSKKFGGKWRLPTEAEWEYTARGGKKSRGNNYSGSNNPEALGWFADNSGSKTSVVGKKLPNELGIYDMTGNLWEWCGDWYTENYYKQSPKENPVGPATGTLRVLRGGSWGSPGSDCRNANRIGFKPDYSNHNAGFRVVLSR